MAYRAAYTYNYFSNFLLTFRYGLFLELPPLGCIKIIIEKAVLNVMHGKNIQTKNDSDPLHNTQFIWSGTIVRHKLRRQIFIRRF